MHTILLAEDDHDIVELLQLYLESSAYKVLVAHDGEAAYDLFKSHEVDLAIVDIMMPKLDGYGLTKLIRQDSNIPIIILSAKISDVDKILGLNIGADDYVTKPFNSLEIVARVQSHLRRYYELNGPANKESKEIIVGSLRLNVDEAILNKNDEIIPLTATEFKILQKLMKYPGQIFTKLQLYEEINGRSQYMEGDDNTIVVHVSNLRDKIEDDAKNPVYIKTLRGIGYKFEKQI
ncbi:response regulator transcription factor [Streptococcus hillyeri]|uniref:DNA-binding response regulator n=1 Tax=Streptococcus hillyeri TaxID=2282420 RepID=A0A3L9E067_9STRE|nr:response regulator transcription factor [Streptococcus hillyeri]RLY04480.1 DNA-binding response regulator [Streptococcus hillyeri]